MHENCSLTCPQTRPVPHATSRIMALSFSPVKYEAMHSAAKKGARYSKIVVSFKSNFKHIHYSTCGSGSVVRAAITKIM